MILLCQKWKKKQFFSAYSKPRVIFVLYSVVQRTSGDFNVLQSFMWCCDEATPSVNDHANRGFFFNLFQTQICNASLPRLYSCAVKTCLTQRVQNSKYKSLGELSAGWITVWMKVVIIFILVICTQSSVYNCTRFESERGNWNKAGSWISSKKKKLPARLPNLHPTFFVFIGLRPSRKPRWLPLLPRRPLRLPLSRQGPQSRRRRSWAPTMRSRRTPQTTAKVIEITCPTPLLLLTMSIIQMSSPSSPSAIFSFFLPPSWCVVVVTPVFSRLFGRCQKGAAV